MDHVNTAFEEYNHDVLQSLIDVGMDEIMVLEFKKSFFAGAIVVMGLVQKRDALALKYCLKEVDKFIQTGLGELIDRQHELSLKETE